jgi:hypothetical protein
MARFFERLWVGMLTRSEVDAGTDNRLHLDTTVFSEPGIQGQFFGVRRKKTWKRGRQISISLRSLTTTKSR